MINWLAKKLFSIPRYEAIQIRGHLYVILKTEKYWGVTVSEVLPGWYSDIIVHQKVKFLNSLYEKAPN